MRIRLHLIGNSHLDPVWLWDWREGLNESLITRRTIVRLMDEYPDITYIRGETSIYRHIQEHDRPLFARILGLIRSGRWDVVGGTLCQPDTNLPATETLNRHFTAGLDYMRRELGVRPRVAWAADSFGHSAGWPEIYAAAGMDYFACSRPNTRDLPLPSPAFWWEGPGGGRVLAWRLPVGWYGSDRDEIVRRLDSFRAAAADSRAGERRHRDLNECMSVSARGRAPAESSSASTTNPFSEKTDCTSPPSTIPSALGETMTANARPTIYPRFSRHGG